MKKFELRTDNENYAARVVTLERFEEIPGADRIHIAKINGSNVIVSKSTGPGTRGVYFPVESQINKEFLFKNNLFENASMNVDQKTKGYFCKKGRVRALKLRGTPSEGVFLPFDSFYYFVNYSDWQEIEDNVPFDTIHDIEICKKYVIQNQTQGTPGKPREKGKLKPSAKLVSGQFKFHYSTPKLGDNAHMINPDDFITISTKAHGSSGISSKVLVNRDLSVWEKIKKFLGFKIQLTEYDYLFSSRTVLKSHFKSSHYYKEDIWLKAHNLIKHTLEDKITLFFEIVGWVAEGAGMIQKGYSYGCKPGTLDVYVYRGTTTEPDGTVREWPMQEVIEFCQKKGIKHVPIIYQGLAKDMFPDLPLEQHWNQEFVERLRKMPPMEKDCPYCDERVPFEGLVVRANSIPTALKLKCFSFLKKESADLDKGEVDIESQEAQ